MKEKEFKKINGRRLDLLTKQHSGFTEEENNRRFDQVPGWEEECERRYQVNLTDEERQELATLTAQVEEYISKKYPMPFEWIESELKLLSARNEALLAKVRARLKDLEK